MMDGFHLCIFLSVVYLFTNLNTDYAFISFTQPAYLLSSCTWKSVYHSIPFQEYQFMIFA